MKRIIILALALCLCICTTIVNVGAINGNIEIYNNGSNLVDGVNVLYVVTDYYIDPEEYNKENAVFHGVPITEFGSYFITYSQEYIEQYAKNSDNSFKYLIRVPEGTDLEEAKTTLLKNPQIKLVNIAEYRYRPDPNRPPEINYSIGEDGTYYNFDNAYGIVDLVIPEEYNGLPVKGFGDWSFDFGIDFNGFDVPISACRETIKTITLTENIHLIRQCSEWLGNIQYNEYNGLKYLGTKDNPYYALVGIDANVFDKELVLHEDTEVIAEGIDGSFYAEQIILSDSLKYINYGAFRGFHYPVLYPEYPKILKYNEYCGFRYLGTPTNPYHALVGIENTDSTHAVIHEDTKIITRDAFYCNETREYATRLESITIPESVITVTQDAFINCSSLKEINFEADSMDDLEICEIITGIPKNVTINWGYGKETVPEESVPTEPTADESNGVGAFVWIGIGAIVAGAVIFLIIKKSKR